MKDDFLKGTVNAWMNILPCTFYSFKIESKEILSEKNSFEYSWGLAICEDEMHNFDLEINENVEYICPKICISSVVLSSEEEYIMRDSLQFMVDYIKENQYVITGDIIGKIIFTERISGKSKSYLEVNIPIELDK